jgi:hypothetical protein
MAPSDIQATFFNGQPFTAATLSGVKFKMTFTSDGKMTREPLGESGSKSAGTWRLNAQGFCTSWNRAKASCFTVVPIGENKWSVKRIATTIAVGRNVEASEDGFLWLTVKQEPEGCLEAALGGMLARR